VAVTNGFFFIIFVGWLGSIYRYEDGDTTLRKVSSAADFIWSEAPLDILGSVTSITFDDVTSLPIKDHALTTEEVTQSFFFFSLYVVFSLFRFFLYSEYCVPTTLTIMI
jgi:hypothetical protein